MSSKAKSLGTGRFGSSAAAPVSARRQAVAAATGVPTEGVAPPTQLPIGRISPNPDNPRSSLGDLSELAGSLAEHGQKQAITVMNRDAYLKANPGKAANLEPNTTHVVIDGSSRLAAAREAGLTTIKVWVDDEQGADSEQLLESALVANIHRNDLPELDEARALQRLLAIHGSQTALAKRLHKSQGWVSQRLALLNLTPELQEKIGQEPIKFLRAVGNRPKDEQADALEELKRTAAEAKTATVSRPVAGPAVQPVANAAQALDATPEPTAALTADDSEGHYPVIAPGETASPGALSAPTAQPGSQEKEDHYPVMTSPAQQVSTKATDPVGGGAGIRSRQEQPEVIPEPRNGPCADAQTSEQSHDVDQDQPKRLPYDNPFYVASHLRLRMRQDHRARLIQFLLNDLKNESPEAHREVLAKAADAST